MASTADLGAVARAIVVITLLSACDRARSERPEGAPLGSTSSGARDPNPSPDRLASARAKSGERWRHIELADCAPLLTEPGEFLHCAATRRAVDAVLAAILRGASPEETARLAAAAALSAQRASQALRAEGMRRLLEQRRAAPKSSASAEPAASAAPLRAAASAPVRMQQNRELDAIEAYARVATLGLRELGTVLEFGPLNSRQRAFEELAHLSREEPHWAGLRALVQEALLVEVDAELKQRLRGLKEQLGG